MSFGTYIKKKVVTSDRIIMHAWKHKHADKLVDDARFKHINDRKAAYHSFAKDSRDVGKVMREVNKLKPHHDNYNEAIHARVFLSNEAGKLVEKYAKPSEDKTKVAMNDDMKNEVSRHIRNAWKIMFTVVGIPIGIIKLHKAKAVRNAWKNLNPEKHIMPKLNVSAKFNEPTANVLESLKQNAGVHSGLVEKLTEKDITAPDNSKKYSVISPNGGEEKLVVLNDKGSLSYHVYMNKKA
jgi:hypothetical protein